MQAQRRQQVNFKDLETISDDCSKNDTHAIIWDKTDLVGRFYQYRAYHVDFEKEMMRVNMGTKCYADACETLRKGTVSTMQSGKMLVISVGK